jgi:hypothetical protein
MFGLHCLAPAVVTQSGADRRGDIWGQGRWRWRHSADLV